MENLIRAQGNAPLVAFTRHEEPYDDLNPSVQVMFRPLGSLEGKSAAELLQTVALPTLEKTMVDFERIGEIQTVEVGGQKAAGARAKYTIRNGGGASFRPSHVFG
jgi:hypothetical protein